MSLLDRRKHTLRYLMTIAGTVFCLIGTSYPAYADVQSPTELIESTSKQVIQELQTKKDIANNIPAAYAVINKYVSPYIDDVGMARSVLGPQVWKAATTNQQQRFTAAFRMTVMRTYAVALAQYTNETVRVIPLRGTPDSRVIVQTQIMGDGPTIAVNYRLVQQKDGWKVYDFDVEGVSMLRSFRSQFAAELAKNNSLDSLIQTLQQHNRDVQ